MKERISASFLPLYMSNLEDEVIRIMCQRLVAVDDHDSAFCTAPTKKARTENVSYTIECEIMLAKLQFFITKINIIPLSMLHMFSFRWTSAWI